MSILIYSWISLLTCWLQLNLCLGRVFMFYAFCPIAAWIAPPLVFTSVPVCLSKVSLEKYCCHRRGFKSNVFSGFRTEAKAFKSKFSQEILSAMRCIRLMVWCRWTMTPLCLIKVSAREGKKSTTKKPPLIPSLYLLSHQSLHTFSALCISALVTRPGGFQWYVPVQLR